MYKSNKTKFLSIVICLALVLSSLTGCSKSEHVTPTETDKGSEIETGSASLEIIATEPEVPVEDEALITEEPDDYEGKTLSFDTSKRYQVMDGFGAAFTWYAERLVNSEYSKQGFDELINDCGLSILRFKNEYEYSIENKATNAPTIASYYKEASERAALRGEKIKVLLCCWSPPAKLKSDNTIADGYGTIKTDENGEYCYEEYGEWWAESVEYYQSFGIKIDYISIQNEVDFSPESYEGCVFSTRESKKQASYSKAFIAVYNALKKRFKDDAPLMLGPETMTCAPATLSAYTKEIRETCPEALAGYAFHLYQGGSIDESTNNISVNSWNKNFREMSTLLGEDTRKWQTEFYHGKGIETAQLINNALTIGNLNAYIYWSGVWAKSTESFESPDLFEFYGSEYQKSANYYALRHFSQFIRPGYERIEAMSQDSKIKCSAFANENNTKIAAVIINPGPEEVTYRVKGADYTITASDVYQSEFGEDCQDESRLYHSLGKLNEGNTVILPPYSVTTFDLTGYCNDAKLEYEAKKPIPFIANIITEMPKNDIPTEDVVIFESTFEDKNSVNGFSGMGSSKSTYMSDGGPDNSGCMKISGRTQDWNGIGLSTGYFEHYGYMLYVSYDCMMETDGRSISCTSAFSYNKSDQYPSLNNTRVVVSDMEAGKWYHAEGYMTMFSDMDPESFRIYWESAGNTDNFYLDNVKVSILYTSPAPDFETASK